MGNPTGWPLCGVCSWMKLVSDTRVIWRLAFQLNLWSLFTCAQRTRHPHHSHFQPRHGGPHRMHAGLAKETPLASSVNAAFDLRNTGTAHLGLWAATPTCTCTGAETGAGVTYCTASRQPCASVERSMQCRTLYASSMPSSGSIWRMTSSRKSRSASRGVRCCTRRLSTSSDDWFHSLRRHVHGQKGQPDCLPSLLCLFPHPALNKTAGGLSQPGSPASNNCFRRRAGKSRMGSA